MFLRSLMLLVVMGVQVLALAGCGGGGGGGSSANPKQPLVPDTVAPQVLEVAPLDGAVDVAVNLAAITATFSEPILAASINGAVGTLVVNDVTDPVSPVPVPGTVQLSSATIAQFTPAGALPANATLEARITTAAQDLAGNPLAADFVWSFTTGAVPDTTAPTVTSSIPVDGALNVDNLATVSVTFSEDMDPASLNATTFTVGNLAGTIVTAGNLATFTPAIGLAPGVTYTATVTTGAADLAGNALAAPFSFDFTVENLVWGGSIQIGEAGIEEVLSVAVDDAGNTYVFGHTDDDLEAAGANAGGDDLFLVKYDPTGAQLFLKQIGSAGDESATNVVVDKSGNIYIVGSTTGDLGDGFLGGTDTSPGDEDAFVGKLDPTGQILWLWRFGDVVEFDAANAVQVDAAGNVYVAGSTSGVLEVGQSFDFDDAFLTKFAPDGTQLWVRQYGTDDDDTAKALALDAAGNIYVTGSAMGDLEVPATTFLDADAYLVSFDPDGVGPTLIEQFGTDGNDEGSGVVVDSLGNVYVGGFTGGDFDNGGILAPSIDAFIAKFTNGTGTSVIRQFGSDQFDDAFGGLAVDSADNVYVAGETSGDINGELGQGVDDGYVAKFDGSLTLQWTRIIGVAGASGFSSRVAVDPAGNLFVSGSTDGDLFKPNLGVIPSDGFLVKFDPDGTEL
ncbi:hypothetical protein DESUT3_10390 [Desulfuromonas versatilis]|uniref:SbsA Ig-like domain-containing protein n=1 Tax=Desulfuromonas versatilis TaxID=2802975 RepID=A0ABN6DV98_9BACT|nr:SBBP repeat-containing protein [Desulfuromonas versatilis]BCR03970.1 hypothetical protein DESUT3_10390 [Desulfuromonas versatilis]